MTEKDPETSAAPAAQTQATSTPVTSAPSNSPALPTNGALTGSNTAPDRVSSPEVHFPSAESNGTVNLKSSATINKRTTNRLLPVSSYASATTSTSNDPGLPSSSLSGTATASPSPFSSSLQSPSAASAASLPLPNFFSNAPLAPLASTPLTASNSQANGPLNPLTRVPDNHQGGPQHRDGPPATFSSRENGGSLPQPPPGSHLMSQQQQTALNYPALHLLPLNETFIPKQISLLPLGAHIKIGRQTNAKTVPAPNNGYFDSKVLSRMHAEVWYDENASQPNGNSNGPAGPAVWIKDVGSSNGTFINGERLSLESQRSEAVQLHSEDIVEFGIDIASEDNKTIMHHKVATKVHLALSMEEAQALAKNMPTFHRAAVSEAGLRRMSRAGVSSSGMSFDHVLSRLQSELQKSRETGSDLGSLHTTMTDIHATLGGHIPPPLLPTYPRVPPLASAAQRESANASAAASQQAIQGLQAQLNDTQSNLANHVEKIKNLEDLLSQHEEIKNQVDHLRQQMQAAQVEMSALLSSSAARPAERDLPLEPDEDEDEDEDDDRSIASNDTARPFDDEDEEDPDLATRQANGIRFAQANGILPLPLTHEKDQHAQFLREQNAGLVSRIEALSAELEQANQLGLTLQVQHAQTTESMRALEERLAGLESSVQTSVQESKGHWDGWKKAFEESWARDREAWEEEREKMKSAVKEWEEEKERKAKAEVEKVVEVESDSRSEGGKKGKRRKKRRNTVKPSTLESGSSSSDEEEPTGGKHRPTASEVTVTSTPRGALQSLEEKGSPVVKDLPAKTQEVKDRWARELGANKGANHVAITTAGAFGVVAIAFYAWSVVNRD